MNAFQENVVVQILQHNYVMYYKIAFANSCPTKDTNIGINPCKIWQPWNISYPSNVMTLSR